MKITLTINTEEAEEIIERGELPSKCDEIIIAPQAQCYFKDSLYHAYLIAYMFRLPVSMDYDGVSMQFNQNKKKD